MSLLKINRWSCLACFYCLLLEYFRSGIALFNIHCFTNLKAGSLFCSSLKSSGSLLSAMSERKSAGFG